MRDLQAGDTAMAAWWGSTIECVSALRRLEREGRLSEPGFRDALARLRALAVTWLEVAPGDSVRTAAERMLGTHPLRAGDALQLGAALVWRGDSTEPTEFVCRDVRLRDAAAREAFVLLPEERAAA